MQTTINGTPVWITYIDRYQAANNRREAKKSRFPDLDGSCYTGWSFCCCLPGCIPDSAFYGPYRSERAALRAAEEFYAD